MDRACVREDADRRNVQTEDHTDLIHSDSLYKTVKVLLTSEKKKQIRENEKYFSQTNDYSCLVPCKIYAQHKTQHNLYAHLIGWFH
jgi:hypothetical protein